MSGFLDLIHSGSQFLQENGFEDARESSEWLLAHVVGKPKWELYTARERASFETKKQFFDLIKKRATHYPLQYLIGEVSFRKLSLTVRPEVLIPRPETEILVDVVLRRIQENTNENFQILDIGTGTGCIGISLAREIENSYVTVADISNCCIQLAKENSLKNKVDRKMSFERTDLWNGITEKFDVIVSNPPYLSDEDFKKLMPEAGYEPVSALSGGADGLQFYRKIAQNISEILKPNGLLVLEIGYTQREEVTKLLEQNNFYQIQTEKDLAKLDRIISGRLKS